MERKPIVLPRRRLQSIPAGTGYSLGAVITGASLITTYVNSTPATANPSFSGFTSPGDYVFGNTAIDADISEEFCTNTAMSAGDIASAIAYLTAKW